jgi:hypothetical protein
VTEGIEEPKGEGRDNAREAPGGVAPLNENAGGRVALNEKSGDGATLDKNPGEGVAPNEQMRGEPAFDEKSG